VIARGQALAVAADCAGCHTADPATPFAGGKRIDTPFGAIYSPNLTPDRQTGIGGWSDDSGACIACDEADGSGAPRIYPPLPGNTNLQSTDPTSTLRVVLDGAQTVTTARAPNAGSMPAYRDELTDQAIAAVASYIRNSWGNAAPPVDTGQVARARTAR
jgi:mono/diheme cytochrome c family protein